MARDPDIESWAPRSAAPRSINNGFVVDEAEAARQRKASADQVIRGCGARFQGARRYPVPAGRRISTSAAGWRAPSTSTRCRMRTWMS
jgi:hypothetical protein